MTQLENPALPMLEVNAAYGTANSPAQLERHAVVIRPSRPEGNRLRISGLEGDDLAGTLVALEFIPVALNSSIAVEQVAWTQAAQLARVWCEHNHASDWQGFVSQELARTLERDAGLLAYLAYEGDAAVGMMVASSDGICGWWSGADDVAHALFARGASDLGRLAVSVSLERRSLCRTARETARFEVLVTGNSDHRIRAASQ